MSAQRIAYATSEISPFSKTGGLADVSGALPAHLHRAGRDVRVFTPLYSTIDITAWDLRPIEALQDVPVRMGDYGVHFSVYAAKQPGTDLDVAFVHCPRLFDRPSLYTDETDEPMRFGFFCRAVLESCQRLQWAPDVIHAHDWQTALLPVYLKSVYAWDALFARTRTVLTVHNLGYQGVFGANVVTSLGLADCSQCFDPTALWEGRIGFLEAGLRHADRITTVSPTYAEEIQLPEYGFGLHGVLSARANDLVGVLNGVDVDVWNPSVDRYLTHRYSARSVWRKRLNRDALLGELGLPPAGDAPTFGIITRLAWQKGVDLLHQPLVELLEAHDVRLIVLASGEANHEGFFADLHGRFPEKVCFYRGFHVELSHRIEAAADFFLMPSRYEPCGLNQMYSLLYGTVPIVRKTGGLADTVFPFDPQTGEGNGIVFEHADDDAVRWALRTALDLHADEKAFKRIRRNGIEGADFSWERSGRAYEALYDELSAEADA